jgi:hypothetical protein
MRQSETAVQNERMDSTKIFNLTEEGAFNAEKKFYYYGDFRHKLREISYYLLKKLLIPLLQICAILLEKWQL